MAPWPISLRPTHSNTAMATAPMKSISGEVIACARTERRLARKSLRAAWRKRSISQNSMLKALTMRLPVMVSCRMF